MPDQKFKRAPAAHRKISEIRPESDIRVRILGRVIGKADGMLVVDDGTARADIVAEDMEADTNSIVRVFARVLPLETGYELRAELVQKMDRLDLDLYEKVFGDEHQK